MNYLFFYYLLFVGDKELNGGFDSKKKNFSYRIFKEKFSNYLLY